VYPGDDREQAVAEIVGAADGVRVYCMVAVGYPEGPGPEVDRYRADKVRIDRWS
jgi:hypothetical protein